jgi:hypothetical protein
MVDGCSRWVQRRAALLAQLVVQAADLGDGSLTRAGVLAGLSLVEVEQIL